MSGVDAVKQILLQSGSAWVLWFLGLLSLTSAAIIVERWLFYRSRGGDLQAMAERLYAHLAAGDYTAAIEELRRSKSVAGTIAAAGLRLADRGSAAADRAMQSAAALERGRLERWLAYLGTLGNNAPFIGLFGTVIGVIGAFEALGRQTATVAATQGMAPQEVMAAIAEALVATAVGLAVAIPAVATYNSFMRQMKWTVWHSEGLTRVLLAPLAAEGHGAKGASEEGA